MRRPAAALLALGCLLLAGCGGGSKSGHLVTTSAPRLRRLRRDRWRRCGVRRSSRPASSRARPTTSRVEPGLVPRRRRAVARDRRRTTATRLGRDRLKARPYEQTVARSEPIGVPGGAQRRHRLDLRHARAAAEAGEVLAAGRAGGGKEHDGALGEPRRRRRSRTRRRSGARAIASEHADAREHAAGSSRC